MADEYILKDKVLNLIEHNDRVCHYVDERYENVVYATAQTICKVVADIPTADVQPVKWISVNDRLPESEKEVLVWYKYTWDAGFTSYGFGINVWYSNTKQWRDGCLLKGVEVLYWQPLPEPPKDGDNNG